MKREKNVPENGNQTGSTFCLGVDAFVRCAETQLGLPKLFLVAFNLVKFPLASLTFAIYSNQSDRNSVSIICTPDDILFSPSYFISLLERILFYGKRTMLSLFGNVCKNTVCSQSQYAFYRII